MKYITIKVQGDLKYSVVQKTNLHIPVFCLLCWCLLNLEYYQPLNQIKIYFVWTIHFYFALLLLFLRADSTEEKIHYDSEKGILP